MRLLSLALLIAATASFLPGCTSEPSNPDPKTPPPDDTPLAYSPVRAARLVDEALERFTQDWQDAIATDKGGQRALLKNAGRLDPAAWLTFAPLEAGARPERELVEWILVRDEAAEKTVDAGGAASRGGKPLYALNRRVWRLGEDDRATKAVDAALKRGLPVEAPGDARVEAGKERPPLSLHSEQTMATALLEWNLEVFDPDQSDPFLGFYFDLGESRAFPQASMPLGAGEKPRALPRKLRATAVIPDPDSAGGAKKMSGEAVRIAK
jgi:hypothetical protein